MSRLLRKNKKGFTLIELIVVIAILAILAAIAIPSFIGITDEAEAKVNLANARNLATAVNTFNALNPDSKITDEDDLSGDLGDLYPEGLSSADATAALAYLTISSEGVATVSESSSTPTST